MAQMKAYTILTHTRNEPLTLETGQPEKPTPSGFRA